jgi:hypothetical protein
MKFPVLAVLTIVVAALVPGVLALWLWGKRFARDPLEFLFTALAWGLLGIGWLALVLAEVGWFSVGLLGGCWGCVTLALAGLWVFRRGSTSTRGPEEDGTLRAASQPHESRQRWGSGRRALLLEAIALTLWGAIAVGLFFRPHEYILGGSDSGVYINLGADIARTGGILIQDPTLESLDPGLYPAFLRALPSWDNAPYYLLPGFYVPVTPRGLVVPQFYPLHPVWQAVGYALGGLRTELLMTPLWALLGALALYFTVRRLWGWRAGLLALIALTVTALQVWFARYPTAEMLTQYLFWTGTWALIAWMDKREPRGLWAALAGAALGLVFLTRIDAYILLALPVLLGIWLWRTHDWRRQDAWFFAPFLLLAVHSLLHGVFLSRPYFLTLFRYSGGLISRSLMAPLAFMGLLMLALIVIATRRQWRLHAVAWANARRSLWLSGGAILLAGAAVFGYFVRPHLGEIRPAAYWYGGGEIPNLDRESLVRLGWYLSPAGIALGVAGMCWMFLKDLNRRTVFFLGAGLFFSLLYLWRIQANPHQIYAMRRYAPVVVPFFTVSAAYMIDWLYENLRGRWRLASAGLTLVWFFGLLVSARGFVSQVDFRGITAELDQFNAALLPHSVLVFNDPAAVGAGDVLGTPLRFLYGHDVFTLRDPWAIEPEAFDETVRSWQASGRAVYWVGTAGGNPYPGKDTQLTRPVEIDLAASALENAYDHKPSAIFDARWQLSLAKVDDLQGGK